MIEILVACNVNTTYGIDKITASVNVSVEIVMGDNLIPRVLLRGGVSNCMPKVA